MGGSGSSPALSDSKGSACCRAGGLAGGPRAANKGGAGRGGRGHSKTKGAASPLPSGSWCWFRFWFSSSPLLPLPAFRWPLHPGHWLGICHLGSGSEGVRSGWPRSPPSVCLWRARRSRPVRWQTEAGAVPDRSGWEGGVRLLWQTGRIGAPCWNLFKEDNSLLTAQLPDSNL